MKQITMKRDVKFRGLYKGHWVYGSLIKRTIKGEVSYQIENADFDDFRQYDVEAGTVGEYTGLKDRHGNDIYEGEHLVHPEYPNEVMQVVWMKGAVGFRLYPNNISVALDSWSVLQVVGQPTKN